MPPSVSRRIIELGGLAIPMVELTGAQDGPLLTVISGVHGCEYASMSGVRRWTQALESRDIRGRVRAGAQPAGLRAPDPVCRPGRR
jgi:predicted deacylase